MVIRINDRRKRKKRNLGIIQERFLVTVSLNTTEKFHGFVRTLLTTSEEQREHFCPCAASTDPSDATPALGDSAVPKGQDPPQKRGRGDP